MSVAGGSSSCRRGGLCFLILLLAMASACGARAQQAVIDWAAAASDHYLVYPDRLYGTSSGVALKLDLWQAQTPEPVPTVVYYHGGGWGMGDRAGAVPSLMPWLARGWNVVNVEYRMASAAPAPAAVEDARCALRWIYRNAAEFHLDTGRIIVTGHSAGGHLALMAGMLSESDGLDNNCPSDPGYGESPIRVAAIVDWYGPTDVKDMLEGPDRRTYAVAWLGGQPNRDDLARRVSPLTYVRPGLPPVFIVHGNQDPTVPYTQSVRLHEELDRARVPNQLFTIEGGKHGSFGAASDVRAYGALWSFLARAVPSLAGGAAPTRSGGSDAPISGGPSLR